LHATELLYLDDAYLQQFTATVIHVEPADQPDHCNVVLDRTAFYVTGGGQPHDTGVLNGQAVLSVTKSEVGVVHRVASSTFSIGDSVDGVIDWDRRHKLMRTHTALHVLCGVIWNEWKVPVTGGNMEPLQARMDFAFDPLPEGFAQQIEALVNAELVADRPISVGYLDYAAAQTDPELIRTKVNMIPASVTRIRVVDIVGLDKQADGGTHVARTSEVGQIKVEKTESKGKGNKRLRVAILDRP
jgi:misacylated tRNA(Ala) deacylase